jgi:hypothetical protein
LIAVVNFSSRVPHKLVQADNNKKNVPHIIQHVYFSKNHRVDDLGKDARDVTCTENGNFAAMRSRARPDSYNVVQRSMTFPNTTHYRLFLVITSVVSTPKR